MHLTYRCAAIRCGYVEIVALTIDGSLSIHARIESVGQLVRQDPISASRMEKPTVAGDCRGDGQARHGFIEV